MLCFQVAKPFFVREDNTFFRENWILILNHTPFHITLIMYIIVFFNLHTPLGKYFTHHTPYICIYNLKFHDSCMKERAKVAKVKGHVVQRLAFFMRSF